MAKVIKKKKAKSETQRVNDALDEIWSEIIKVEAGYKCAYCGKESYLNSHHLFSRNNYSVRWDIINGICLCSGHHTLSSSFSAHLTPIEFVEWIKLEYGEEWYDNLRAKARVEKHWTLSEKQELLEKLINYRRVLEV